MIEMAERMASETRRANDAEEKLKEYMNDNGMLGQSVSDFDKVSCYALRFVPDPTHNAQMEARLEKQLTEIRAQRIEALRRDKEKLQDDR